MKSRTNICKEDLFKNAGGQVGHRHNHKHLHKFSGLADFDFGGARVGIGAVCVFFRLHVAMYVDCARLWSVS